MNKLISVIIPVYNCEKYIKRCLESVIKQSYANFEVIVINDGSIDNSLEVIKEVSQEDKRIRIVSQENKGVSYSRRHGVEIANGDYITFIDADDYIESRFLETMYNEIIKNKVGLVCCNSIDVGIETTDINNPILKNEIVSDTNKLLKDFFEGRRYAYTIWAKLYSKKILENMIYPDIKYTEDTYLMLEVFNKIDCCSLITYQGYYYYHNENSITNSINYKERYLNMLETYKYLLEICSNKSIENYKKANQILVKYLYGAITVYALEKDDEWNEFLNQYFYDYYGLIKHKYCKKNLKWIILRILCKNEKKVKNILEKIYKNRGIK